MRHIPSLNDDNADKHYDDKATDTDQIDGHDCSITLNVQQLTKSFHAALPRSCKHS